SHDTVWTFLVMRRTMCRKTAGRRSSSYPSIRVWVPSTTIRPETRYAGRPEGPAGPSWTSTTSATPPIRSPVRSCTDVPMSSLSRMPAPRDALDELLADPKPEAALGLGPLVLHLDRCGHIGDLVREDPHGLRVRLH